MNSQDIATMIAQIGVPYAYRQFTKETAVPPPFVCFYLDGSDNFAADDKVFAHVEELIVELYTDSKDYAIEERIEAILDAHDLPWDRQEFYLGDEQMSETVYTVDVLITPSNTVATT